jgi:uncharacterized protein YndB with AHSA1/START domain
VSEPSVIHNTFVIERSYPKPPETVFAAFADPAKKGRWFAEGHNHEVEEFHMDFQIGGAERTRYVLKEGTPFPGVVMSTDGTFQDIVPNRRIVTASAMTFAGRRISATLVTIELLATDTGTDLICTHQGAFFEGADGPQMREAGWRAHFDKLAAYLAR